MYYQSCQGQQANSKHLNETVTFKFIMRESEILNTGKITSVATMGKSNNKIAKGVICEESFGTTSNGKKGEKSIEAQETNNLLLSPKL